MRRRFCLSMLVCVLAAGCKAPAFKADAPDPLVLFHAGQTYELVDSCCNPVGYAFAVDDGPRQQTIRWILLPEYESPTVGTVGITTVDQIGGDLAPKTVGDFVKLADKLVTDVDCAAYVKSCADTCFTGSDPYVRPVLPVPPGRPAPRPLGQGMELCHVHEIDGGSVGIVKGLPGGPPHSAAGDRYGIVGAIFAGPIHASNTEAWFVPPWLLRDGIDKVTLSPFANKAEKDDDLPSLGMVVIVVNSSYYASRIPDPY